jgi:DNA (cytosine-5)-methyltransferase 1
MAPEDDDDALLNAIIEQSNRLSGRGGEFLPMAKPKAASAWRKQRPLGLASASSHSRHEERSSENRGTRRHVIAGLFAGIGGLERGLARAGHRTALLCENEPAAMAILRTHFPEIPLHGDVRTLARLPDETTLLAAGFPCQDLSQAGKTAGIAGASSGLVGEVFRLIDRQRVPFVLLENVPFMLQLGGGRAINLIASTFEEMGYKWAYRVVDTRAFGLPQRRRRVFFLASRSSDPREVLFADDAEPFAERRDFKNLACGFYWTEGIRGLGWAVDAIPTLKGGSTVGIPSPPAIVFPDGMVGMPDIRDAERLQGFPADWTKPAATVARAGVRWKLAGNAVTVLASEWLGRRLARPGKVLDFKLAMMPVKGSWPTAAWNVGEGRMRVEVSEWPVSRQYVSLTEFLKYAPTPLSAKATAGFLSRTERGGLRFPPNFLESLRRHLVRVSVGGRIRAAAA